MIEQLDVLIDLKRVVMMDSLKDENLSNCSLSKAYEMVRMQSSL